VKLLGLLRHAKSDWSDFNQRDFDRGLNGRGELGAALMGQHIRDHGVRWDHLLASPAARVRATLAASGLERVVKGPVQWQERVYLADSVTLMELLGQVAGDPASVLLMGHNPGLQELIFELAGYEAPDPLSAAAAQKFPTAAFAVLELDVAGWADLRPGCGRLVHFARPRDLDAALGPQASGVG